ncbi:hypothetical protein EYC59_02190 [Candidatus Saccharibacteria bacterium]|nr:MAG: hypothetical protein EYC59_02190 [Candidatus Saccharibacteria bacterium]
MEKVRKDLAKLPYTVAFLDQTENNKTVIVRVRDYTQQEFDEFVKARDVISEQVLQYMDLYNMVAIMYDNLVAAYKKRVEQVEAQRGISARDDLAELNAYFAALVANFGMYLGCVPNKISSKRQDILDAHNQATHDEYDNSFAYRLFCVLRNYTLHHTPPITGIRGSSKMAKKPGEVDVEYEIFIEKNELMKNRTVANKLAADFALPIEKYPVIETAYEAMQSLRKIHWKTIKALLTPIHEEIALIESLAALTAKHKKQPYIAEFMKNGLDAQLHLIPTQILEFRSKAAEY